MRGRGAHQQLTTFFSVAMLVLGLAMIMRAVSGGGGPFSVGVIMGVLFVLAGAGRIWSGWRTR